MTGPPGLDIAAMRARLLAERAVLQGDDADSAANRAPVELDQTSVGRLSRMDAIQQQAMALAAGRRRAVGLQRITAALSAMDSGDYGWCQECGEPIAPRRLALDPATLTCVACAEKSGR